MPYKILSVIAAALLAILPGAALPTDTYAQRSRLATGRWVKVSVSAAGLYRIPAATLRQWGFSDPAAVRVCGYGGARIPDALSAAEYIDDLPVVPSVNAPSGVTFYAVGPAELTETRSGHYRLVQSPYTSVGYYFVTDCLSDEPAAAPATATAGATGGATVGTALAQHEREMVMATHVGPLMVGEDLSGSRAVSFDVATPGRVAGPVNVSAAAVTRMSSAGRMNVSVGDAKPLTATIGITSGNYTYGTLTELYQATEPLAAGEKITAAVSATLGASLRLARLDYVALTYRRALTMEGTSAPVEFMCAGPVALAGSSDWTTVWDITDPRRPMAVQTSSDSGTHLEWTPTGGGTRRYVAWDAQTRVPAPQYAGTVRNQDLHAPLSTPEMVIFTDTRQAAAARRIAELHRSVDGMEVEVIDVSLVYNEFSSGAPDISGLRKYLKMIYDRGIEAGKPLRYALLMGRATLDHRGLVQTSASGYVTLPWWVVRSDRQSLVETDAFGTDDFLAMLEDGQGTSLGIDVLSIAVGRIPAIDAAEADAYVDKLYQYVRSSKKTGWKNKLLLLADDEDNAIHVKQSEDMVAFMETTRDQQHLFNKIYIDSYDLSGGEYPGARRDMFRALDEGVALWYYVGHATNHSWTAENQLNFTDINNMYLRNLPFVVASTCNFLQWDYHEMSGGEIMFKEQQGGCIGMVSATRPAYITDNGYLLAAFGRSNLQRDADGRLLTPGEMYRRAKNDIRDTRGEHVSNTNRLRFVFMGDPALRLSTPDNIVRVTSIGGRAPESDADDPVTIAAMANVEVRGSVTAPDGTPLTDFDGVVSIELYDAQQSRTTKGRGEGAVEVFETDGARLFAGSAPVRGGEFTLKVSMPSLIADNFRPAAMSLYAYATNSDAEAIGVNRDFYVYGLDEPAKPDTEAPSIESLVLNHSGFAPGDATHSSPLVIARVSDNVGINLSTAGVGQHMTLTVDGFDQHSDVSLYYIPDPDGSAGGTINYPLDNLADGDHALRLRVYDTSGNPAEMELPFKVVSGLAPQIFDVYTDANPASTAANFYIRHDRPESVADVTVTVYDLMGRPIWSGSRRGLSDLDVSSPVTWDLTDRAGRRVTRGIYLYRASITADGGESYQTVSRRIAVTAK